MARRALPRVLVVDDDPVQVRLMERCLGRWGWAVDKALSGQSAAEMFARGAYEVLICDVDLGGVDGIKIAQMLREADSALRVLIVSALPENLERAREAGFTCCLNKPFPLEDLKSTLGGCLRPPPGRAPRRKTFT